MFIKRKKKIVGNDSEGKTFVIKVSDGEEVTEETFKELSNGTGGAPGYEQQ